MCARIMCAVLVMPAPDYHCASHSSPSPRVTCDVSDPAPERELSHWALNKTEPACLGYDPGVFETLGSGGSFLWQQLQHGEEEGAELGGFLPWPLVLIQQDLKQAPWLQL